MIFFSGLNGHAQYQINFTTLGNNCTFTFNPANLQLAGSNSIACNYNDTQDTLTFQGQTYTNLNFSVINNWNYPPGPNHDGFQILVNKSPYDSSSRLEIDVNYPPTTINGTTANDLLTTLTCFNSVTPILNQTLYQPLSAPYQQQGGTVSNYQVSMNSQAANPQIQKVAVNNRSFEITLQGAPGTIYVVEANTNIFGGPWLPIQTNTLVSNSWKFVDGACSNNPTCYYRIKSY